MPVFPEPRLGNQDSYAPRRRPRLGRTRTGCLTCRRRRKKCDERRPTCVACTRNKLTCSWPSRPLNPSRLRSTCTHQVDHETSPLGFVELLTDGEEEPSAENRSLSETTSFPGDDSHTVSRNWTAFKLTSPLSFSLGNDRTTLRMPLSPLLLRNYIEDTSNLLVVKPPSANPFVFQILPLAYFDDVLMNAVLALGGQHLIGRYGPDFEIQQTTWYHYALVLRHVRAAANDLSTLSGEEILHLLLVMLILCNVEAFSGNRNGSMFAHLRAARQLILHLLEHGTVTSRREKSSTMGLALETYCFLALVGNVTPYGALEDRTMPFDSFLLSLAHLKTYDTFGIFFSCGYSLFEMIPRIALFSRERLREEQQGNDYCSPESILIYQGLLSEIENWRSSAPDGEMKQWEAEHEAAGEIYRHALFIYLKASMCGSTISNPKVICEIQKHVDVVLQSRKRLFSTPYGTIMLWPALITGSCLIQQDQRHSLSNSLRSSIFSMTHVFQASELLELLWNDSDKRSFGPYGLSLMMKKHDLNLCVV